MGLLGAEKMFTQLTSVTDGWTDRLTECQWVGFNIPLSVMTSLSSESIDNQTHNNQEQHTRNSQRRISAVAEIPRDASCHCHSRSFEITLL